MAINIDYLDCLYRWKVEAEQALDAWDEAHGPETPQARYDELEKGPEINELLDKIDKMERAALEANVNRLTTTIKQYLAYHNN